MASDIATDAGDTAPQKSSKRPLLIGVALAALLGAGGFYAGQSGLVLPSDDTVEEMENKTVKAAGSMSSIAFVPIPPLVINLGPGSSNRHLKFEAQLEVEDTIKDEVARLLPRITNVLNGYLRAVDIEVLESRGALFTLRSQMLRRAQIVVGDERVRDLLIMEFVLN